MNARRSVVVTGAGAVSALGMGVDALWGGMIAGRCGIAAVEELVQAGARVTAGGATPLETHRDSDRDRVLARHAITAALRQAGLAEPDTALVWATGLDTFGTRDGAHRAAGACFAGLAQSHRRPRRMVAMACASGTASIGEAFHLVRSGRIDAAVAGGSSAMLCEFYVTGFAALGALAVDEQSCPAQASCRPFDRDRRGFALADGAGALVLESLEAALARRATPLAEVAGYGCSSDAHDLNRPPEDGAGARRCLQRVLRDAGVGAADIDAVSAHGTGTVAGDAAEATALRQVFGMRPAVYSCKGAIGHSMAAAGALEAVVALRTIGEGVVPATCNLKHPDAGCELNHVMHQARPLAVARTVSLSCGMGGQNAAVLLRQVGS